MLSSLGFTEFPNDMPVLNANPLGWDQDSHHSILLLAIYPATNYSHTAEGETEAERGGTSSLPKKTTNEFMTNSRFTAQSLSLTLNQFTHNHSRHKVWVSALGPFALFLFCFITVAK